MCIMYVCMLEGIRAFAYTLQVIRVFSCLLYCVHEASYLLSTDWLIS